MNKEINLPEVPEYLGQIAGDIEKSLPDVLLNLDEGITVRLLEVSLLQHIAITLLFCYSIRTVSKRTENYGNAQGYCRPVEP